MSVAAVLTTGLRAGCGAVARPSHRLAAVQLRRPTPARQVLTQWLSVRHLVAARSEAINTNLQLHFTDKEPPVCSVLNEDQRGQLDLVNSGQGDLIRSSAGDSNGGRCNPLAILMAWMAAKDVHLQRYQKLYLDQGFDVLTVKTHLLQFALPKKDDQHVAEKVLDFLLENPSYTNLVVHAFSVGGYQMGEILARLGMSGSRYTNLLPRFKAQVYDSLVEYTGAAVGFSKVFAKDPRLQKILELVFKIQAAVLYPVSTVHHKAASEAVHDSVLTCPVLLFGSRGDNVSSLDDIADLANEWRQKGLDVSLCAFDDSKHVQHITKYPEQYTNEVIRLLRKAKLVK
uniref:Uncharacterized protein n=2 Tax=Ixodes ricinus TaxID=34613 RepID=V5GGI6_IXORI